MDINLERYYRNRKDKYIKSFKRIELYKNIKNIITQRSNDIVDKYINSKSGKLFILIPIREFGGKIDLNDDVKKLIIRCINNIGIYNNRLEITKDSQYGYEYIIITESV